MAFMRGEPLVKKTAVLAKYAVLPAAMIAALFYSPPNYIMYIPPTTPPPSSKHADQSSSN